MGQAGVDLGKPCSPTYIAGCSIWPRPSKFMLPSLQPQPPPPHGLQGGGGDPASLASSSILMFSHKSSTKVVEMSE